MATTTAPSERTSGDLPPPKLIAGYGNSHLMGWIVVALIIHGVIIGATSVNYIRDTFDPAGAERDAKPPKTAKTPPTTPGAAKAGAPAPGAAAAAGAAATQQATSAPAAGSAKSTTTSPDSEAAQAEQKKSTPVMKNLSDTAKPGELPKKPDDLGIGLDETNPR